MTSGANAGLTCEATCSVCWVGVVANRDAEVFYTCDTLTYNKTSDDIIVITIMLNERWTKNTENQLLLSSLNLFTANPQLDDYIPKNERVHRSLTKSSSSQLKK